MKSYYINGQIYKKSVAVNLSLFSERVWAVDRMTSSLLFEHTRRDEGKWHSLVAGRGGFWGIREHFLIRKLFKNR